MKKIKRQWVGYCVLGVIAMGLAAILMRIAYNVYATRPSIIEWLPYTIGVIVCVVVALLYLFMAYCFAYRQVDEVRGSVESPIIMVKSKELLLNSPIGFTRKINLNFEDTSKPPEVVILFFVKFRPWICTEHNFKAA